MSSSSGSDFENNSFETDEISNRLSIENELSDSLPKGFLISCPINLNQRRKKMLKTF